MSLQGPITRAQNAEARVRELETEIRCGNYMLEERRRIAFECVERKEEARQIARDAIQRCDRLAKELAEAHRETSALEQTNGELLGDLERLARAEKERDRS